MRNVYLLLGSNMGDKLENISTALMQIATFAGSLKLQSSIYKTEAWGNNNQDYFLNKVVEIDTSLDAEKLLATILQIELQLGRVRHNKWEARLIDIDILYYDTAIIETKHLIVPHPYLHVRRFTLQPLAEIAPLFKHPKLLKTNIEMLAECDDKLEVVVMD